MKKLVALIMTLALAAGVLAVPVLAEEENSTADQVTSATAQTGHGSRQQMPRMPGQNNQNGQMPQTPGQNNQNGQMPQTPGQNSQNGQMPGQNSQMPAQGRGGRNNRQGKGAAVQNGKAGKQLIFDQLLADGVITQEIYDAITAWISEKMPQAQQEAAVPAEGSEPPAQPEGASNNSAEEKTELLKGLLESGAITREQYDVLNSDAPAVPAAPAAAPET